MSQKWASKFMDNALTAIDIATSEAWWEYAIEFVPGIGDGYGAVKGALQGSKLLETIAKIEKRASAVKSAYSKSSSLRNALKLTSGEAHHIIPKQLLTDNDVVQDAVVAGFDFNGIINGVKAITHHGSHPKYTESIRQRILDWSKANPNYTPEEAKSFLEGLAKNLKDQISQVDGDLKRLNL